MEFKKSVKIRKEKFGAIVFDTLGERVFVTNPCGAIILTHLEAGEKREDFILSLAQEFNADPSQIKNDVDAFTQILEERNLLVK